MSVVGGHRIPWLLSSRTETNAYGRPHHVRGIILSTPARNLPMNRLPHPSKQGTVHLTPGFMCPSSSNDSSRDRHTPEGCFFSDSCWCLHGTKTQQFDCVFTPTPVPALADRVAANTTHSAAIDPEGRPLLWGGSVLSPTLVRRCPRRSPRFQAHIQSFVKEPPMRRAGQTKSFLRRLSKKKQPSQLLFGTFFGFFSRVRPTGHSIC